MRYRAIAQTCGGCQKKTIAKSSNPAGPTLPVRAASAISGDTAPSDNIVELAKGADILIHECVIPDYGMTKAGKFSRKVFHEKETKNQRTGHTSPTGLGKLAEQAGVKKLVAYHLAPYTSVPAAVEMSEKYTGPNPGPEIWSKFIHAMKNQYSGPVILAEDAMVIKV